MFVGGSNKCECPVMKESQKYTLWYLVMLFVVSLFFWNSWIRRIVLVVLWFFWSNVSKGKCSVLFDFSQHVFVLPVNPFYLQ